MAKRTPRREDFELNPAQHPDIFNPEGQMPPPPAETDDATPQAPASDHDSQEPPQTQSPDVDAPKGKHRRGVKPAKPPRPPRPPRGGIFNLPFLRRFGNSPRYDPLVRTADEVKRYTVVHKVLVTLLGTLVAATAITYVFATLYSKYGSLTVSINKYDSVNYCLTLSEDATFENQISRLNAKAAEDITNISANDLPYDIDSINGEHNGANYLAYTFYVKNVGHDTVDYEYNMFVTNVKNNVDQAIRIRIYKDGVPTDYARTRSNGAGAEPGTTEFLSSRTITRTRVDSFAPDEVHKFTVVIWLEGNDPDCTDDLIDGALKTDMIISVVEARQEEGTSGTEGTEGTSGAAGAAEVSALLEGKWYAYVEAVDNATFLTFDFNGSSLQRGNYDCEMLPAAQDDHSANNIYYNDRVYPIVGGASRRGSYTVTSLEDGTFRMDVDYPADAQYPEAETESYVIAVYPNDPNTFHMRSANGQQVSYTYVRGDVEDLRTYRHG